MELYSIDDLELYIDEEVERKGKTYITRKPLLRDLEIGEVAYLKNTNNKIIKHNEHKYTFHRFEDINTHLEDQRSPFTLDDVKERLNKKLDYTLKYAEDRVKLVNHLLENDNWIASLLSSTQMISKEHKKKKSFLAEEQTYDKLIDLVNDYMYHAKFKNEEDEQYFEGLVERSKLLSRKKHKSEQEHKELFEVNGIISDYNNRIFSKEPESELSKKQTIEKNEKLKNGESFNFEDSREIIRKRYKQHHQFDITFWDRMGYSQKQKAWRNKLINTYEQTLERLKKQLGYDQKIEERKLIQEKLLNTFKTLTFIVDGREIKILPKRQLKILNDQYGYLKSDFKLTIEKLTDQFTFKRIDKTSTEYCWNDNTWYEREGGIVEISQNIINYSDIRLYQGLLENYYELKEKYFDKMNDDMWAILHDFDDLIHRTAFTNDEKFVLNHLFSGLNQTEIRQQYKNIVGESMNEYRISNMINSTISNKLLKTYLGVAEDWLYTYKLKGKWKQCTTCGEIKTISNDRHFSKDSRKSDGFQSSCKVCERLRKSQLKSGKTHEYFVAEVSLLTGDEYAVIGEYENARTKIKIKHLKCNNTYEVTPSSFIQGSRCPKCFLESITKTQDTFVKQVYDLVGNEYKVLGEYVNSSTKLLMKHNCGYEYKVAPSNFLHGSRCPNCTYSKTHDEFVKEANSIFGDEFTVISRYEHVWTKITVRHNKCGEYFTVRPDNFLQMKSGCPFCKSSKGESTIKTWLDTQKIKYEPQYKINECRNILPLPFDFAIFNENKLVLLIEYDGEQHYKPIDCWGGEDYFESIKLRDSMKNDYCEENGIKLLRIPYWDFNNIEDILTNNLLKIEEN